MNTKSNNFYNALKNNPEEIIKWCESEIKEYEKLIKLIKKGKYETCSECGKSDETVYGRNCGYSADVGNNPNDWEVVCDACEEQHCLDI